MHLEHFKWVLSKQKQKLEKSHQEFLDPQEHAPRPQFEKEVISTFSSVDKTAVFFAGNALPVECCVAHSLTSFRPLFSVIAMGNPPLTTLSRVALSILLAP